MTGIKPLQDFSAILFDLDGTLVDTAPDLAFALNTLLEQEGHSVRPYDDIRPVASHGSAALLALGFGISTEDKDYSPLQKRFLQLYQDNIARETALFEGMEEVLSALEKANITWGIVTNKPAFLTEPLLDQLNLSHRAACIVSADTTPFSKPHPAPMLHACDIIQHQPESCLYIGDAQRDIEAGKNANMQTVTALYGYLSEQDDPDSWLADTVIKHPRDILQWL
ncbi:MAG: HAD-IA family hydrolase [Gammaproteobacteria bacterium]|nr:HAD-IA family hydrolase [Gammaproteobacteria bacterium]